MNKGGKRINEQPMNEIEKLYKNAGIEPKKKCYYWDCPYSTGMPANDIPYTERNCQYCNNPDKAVYPPFTTEKQLELIKLLGNIRDYTVEIDKLKGVYYVGCRSAGSNDKLWGSSNAFEDALAELINETWFCLTEEERKQIRDILKGLE